MCAVCLRCEERERVVSVSQKRKRQGNFKVALCRVNSRVRNIEQKLTEISFIVKCNKNHISGQVDYKKIMEYDKLQHCVGLVFGKFIRMWPINKNST